jgi:hypothetical protein
MKNTLIFAFLFASLTAFAQRSYGVTYDAGTSKFKFTVTEQTSNGDQKRIVTLVTDCGDTATVTAVLLERLAKYEEAITQANDLLTSVTMERDSIEKALNNWWFDYGDFSIFKQPVPSKQPKAPTKKPDAEKPKGTKPKTPKKTKQ